MDIMYKQACAAFLAQYIKHETTSRGEILTGWYNYICSPEYKTVGVVLTAQMLILIKDSDLPINFDCMPMIQSILRMQNKDGGWSYRTNVLQSATEPTALSVLAILLWCTPLDDDQKTSVDNGINWLLKYRIKNSLWGPTKKKETVAYTYYSCSVLNYLSRVVSIGGISNVESIKTIVDDGCTIIINAFNDNDNQCGWGKTLTSAPTVFHTAYTVNTLLSINDDLKNTHQIIKASAYLKKYYFEGIGNNNYSRINIGETEIYQYNTNRLVYTHSVDIYVLLALLRSQSFSFLPYVLEKCDYFVRCAENTDWRFRGFVTGWRLFDIVQFCNYYYDLIKNGGSASMKHFKIALTFAGETRPLVEKIAEYLSVEYGKDSILYDHYHEAEFARPSLDSYLQDLYHNKSDLIVVFICSKYAEKKWCGLEWRAIRDILNNMNYDKIMYVKATSEDIDSIQLPGFYSSEDGYIDSAKHTERELADLIIQRYNQTILTSKN